MRHDDPLELTDPLPHDDGLCFGDDEQDDLNEIREIIIGLATSAAVITVVILLALWVFHGS